MSQYSMRDLGGILAEIKAALGFDPRTPLDELPSRARSLVANLRADREAAPAPQVQALLTALKRVTADMDRAGGDGYGMPECPWCKCQFDGEVQHQPDCEFVLARQVLADVEAGIGAARPGVAVAPKEPTPMTCPDCRAEESAGRSWMEYCEKHQPGARAVAPPEEPSR